jgi:protein involved in polysaccharide export with SLBB domain
MRQILLSITICTVLGACGSSAPRVQTAGTLPQAVAQSGANYHLGVGDKVKVTVMGQPDLSGESEVDAGGKIVVPMAGAIDAAGATITEATERVRNAFAQAQVLRDPKVAVQVIEYRPITVTGEVKAPGRYKYTFGLDVRSAVAMGGGFDKRANTKSVIVYRDNQAYAAASDSDLEPGDIVEVARK